MLAVGNVKVTDLLMVTPPYIPEGAHAMTQIVELPPADAGLAPHRHSGPVFGCVLERCVLFEIAGEEPREIVAGEAFWEPGGEVVHYQVANLDREGWSRFLAVCICAPGVEMITCSNRRRSRRATIYAIQLPVNTADLTVTTPG